MVDLYAYKFLSITGMPDGEFTFLNADYYGYVLDDETSSPGKELIKHPLLPDRPFLISMNFIEFTKAILGSHPANFPENVACAIAHYMHHGQEIFFGPCPINMISYYNVNDKIDISSYLA